MQKERVTRAPMNCLYYRAKQEIPAEVFPQAAHSALRPVAEGYNGDALHLAGVREDWLVAG
jgi:hypothetical protein